MLLTLTDNDGELLAQFDSRKSSDHEVFNNLMLDAEHLLSDEVTEKLDKAISAFYTSEEYKHE